MDVTSLLHALKDAAMDIMDLSARVSALEKKLQINAGEEICPCLRCAILRADMDINLNLNGELA